MHIRSLLISTALLAACGGKSTATGPTTPPPPGGGSDVLPPENLAFKDMSADQRVAYMKLRVMPEMKPMFQEFDGKQFADFTCKTCHGKGAEAGGSFDMPNPDLKVLPKPEDFPAYMKDPKVNAWVMFMGGKVKPAMAKLLKVTEYDPATNKGEFSCTGCHLADGMDAHGEHHDHDHDHHDHAH